MFGYYDVTKANNDPDNLEIIDYHSFPTKSDINSIQAPLKDLSFDSSKTPYFTSDRTSKDYCIDLKSGIVLQYPDDRIKYFLEKEPLSENNMVSYNDIGY